jgi:dolichol-phosphate mannosyltransferase
VINLQTLSLLVPVYNNAGSLNELWLKIRGVKDELASIGISLQVIFVEDGSQDDSLLILESLTKSEPQVKVIKLTKNFGAIAATHAGLKYVTGDCLVVLAADLQDPPELITEMARNWQKGSKFVICTRISRSDPLLSKLFSYMYYRILRKQIFPDFPKGGFDLALIDKDMFPHIMSIPKTFSIQLYSFTLGRTPLVIPYHRQERLHGKSGWTLKKKFDHFLDVFFGYSMKPIRLVSKFGFSLSILGFVYGVYIFGSALANNVPVQGFASIITVLSVFFGFTLIMLGIIGEYLWRIYLQTQGTPNHIVDRVIGQ